VTTPRRAIVLSTVVVWALAASTACGRTDRQTPEALRAEIAALVTERDALRGRLNTLMVSDPRIAAMPDTPVRVGVPTALARDLIQRVIGGFVDQVTLTLRGIKVRKQGTVKKVVVLGTYDLRVTVTQVTARLKTAAPNVTFGNNRVGLAMPVTLSSGTGRATIDFTWDGRNIGGAVCGDMDLTQAVSGTVRPTTYPVSGSLDFAASANTIVAKPRLPRMVVNLKVAPSEASWGAAQKLLDDKRGVCGFVLDRVDILGLVKATIDKGFDVRLPTDKLKAVAIPVGVEPTLEVRGEPMALGIRLGDLVITDQMIWLGADVSMTVGDGAVAPSRAGASTSVRSR
jgi:hypothetical protein